MKRISSYIYRSSAAFTKAMRWELKFIFRDKSVFFSFVVSAILVAFAYTYLYSSEVLEDLPIGVIDEDNTATSRQLLRMIDATSQAQIRASYTTTEEAGEAFQRGDVRGVVIIPRDFGRNLQRGEQPTLSVYADGSYMLYYKQVVTAVKLSATYMSAGVRIKKISAQGKLPTQARSEVSPVSAKVVNLYNPSGGYATALIPVVLIIVFQTTMLTAVGMLGGTMREEKKLHRIYPDSDSFFGAMPIVMGKATAYLLLAMVILIIFLGIVMPLYGIPLRSAVLPVVVFMIPFLLAVVFFGLTLLTFFRRREDAIMVVMYTSLPAMMITGFSWPSNLFPQWITALSYVLPSTWGAKGFVSLTQMGAELSTIKEFWIAIWVLCGVYLITASFTMRRILRKANDN
ncbi:ABC-2 type transport system permease protein [Capnocytophaga haemolytica]|uniref:ABC transporter permease n=1 Tax=Capnocytophaga haemolytica TaxID=45243 RepID=A0AAX2GZJ6_9FLAO|nr:ABC transporter permease [Capnocytophaga haemolytica]AMD84230.1 ABC transporter permease [Capnocytophaga haemolytica]SFN95102.1 ABC-2 type transport system permease protein [Capnocytophaga haemolytica]SNV12469.1 Inner membrane transport permease ybhR [Capnocytophaga haemolytica]